MIRLRLVEVITMRVIRVGGYKLSVSSLIRSSLIRLCAIFAKLYDYRRGSVKETRGWNINIAT